MKKFVVITESGFTYIYLLVRDGLKYRFVNMSEYKIEPMVFSNPARALDWLDRAVAAWEEVDF